MAFKDWAIIVDALGRGEQIIILRKGGIAEGRGGFHVDHDDFLLFPTRYHQQGEMVVESAAARHSAIASAFPPDNVLRLAYCAHVVEWRELRSLEKARQLRGQHIWSDQVIEDRYEWRREQKIFAIALRVSRLAATVDLRMSEDYGGCKSWIELDEDVDVSAAKPVMSDAAFSGRLEEFLQALA